MSEIPKGEPQPHPDGENRRAGKYERVTASITDLGQLEPPLPSILEDRDNEIVFLEDRHGKTPLDHILNMNTARGLKELGFTHYLIEGSADADTQMLLDKLNAHQDVNLVGASLAPISQNELYINAIAHMAEGGLEVRTIDHPQKGSVTQEDRERFIFQKIKDIRDKGGKPIISIGGIHAHPGNIHDQSPSSAQRLLNAGENVLSIAYRHSDPQRNSSGTWESLSRPKPESTMRIRIERAKRFFRRKRQ